MRDIEEEKAVGYKYLKSYQLATVIYDLTVRFCEKYIPRTSRTNDQMIQAGRSGKQNIAEGYLEKSLKMYIKLLGVARGSLGELLEDYEDYARQHGIPIWPIEKCRQIKEISDIRQNFTPNFPYIPDLPYNLELTINLMVTLINQANYLIDQQLKSLEAKFISEGGYSENLLHKRLEEKSKNR